MRFPKSAKRRSKHSRGEKGQSIVELSMVITVFFMILFGIFDFGIAAYTFHYVSDSAREAARWSIVHGADSDSPATADDVESFVKNSGRIPPGIDPARITVTPEWPGIEGNDDCPANSNSPGCPVKVTIEYDYDFLLPFISSPAIQMSSSAQRTIAY